MNWMIVSCADGKVGPRMIDWDWLYLTVLLAAAGRLSSLHLIVFDYRSEADTLVEWDTYFPSVEQAMAMYHIAALVAELEVRQVVCSHKDQRRNYRPPVHECAYAGVNEETHLSNPRLYSSYL